MKATDCKCCICGKQAVAFWPLVDPDIPEQPYCRECLDKQKIQLLVNLGRYDKEGAKAFVEAYNKAKKRD